MSGYKRLRQAHHKEVQQLDERIKVESDQLKNKLEKEYDHAVALCDKELLKLRQSQQAELDKRHRQNEEELKKATKSRKNSNEHELKSFINVQKKEYRHNKDQEKAVRKRNFGLFFFPLCLFTSLSPLFFFPCFLYVFFYRALSNIISHVHNMNQC